MKMPVAIPLFLGLVMMGCPKKPATPQAVYPEPVEVDLPDDDELDDLPEAGDKDIK